MFLYNTRIIEQAEFPSEKAKLLKQKFGLRRIPPFFLHLLDAVDMELQQLPSSGDFGILYLSRFGAADQHIRFRNELEDFPPDQITPGLFAHSVFNAPAAYLAMAFHSHGPVLCLNGWQDLCHAALVTADCWLESGICSRILLIMADEACTYTAAVQANTDLKLFLPGRICMLSGEHYANAEAEGFEAVKTVLQKG